MGGPQPPIISATDDGNFILFLSFFQFTVYLYLGPTRMSNHHILSFSEIFVATPADKESIEEQHRRDKIMIQYNLFTFPKDCRQNGACWKNWK